MHLLLIAWLINTLVCYHPVFGGDAQALRPLSGQLSGHPDNTLADMILHHLVKGKSHGAHKKVAVKSRYVSVRSVSFLAAIPQNIILDLAGAVQNTCPQLLKYWESKVFLPPHHHFLFRLSPF